MATNGQVLLNVVEFEIQQFNRVTNLKLKI